MNIKEILYNHCLQYVEQRKARILNEIALSQASANNETKSSAGDKYETGRAMAQLEIERYLQQLSETEKLQQLLLTIEPTRKSERVILGSLVITSSGVFYIAISLGVFTYEGNNYLIVSTDSPIGKLLAGKRVGDSIFWNKKTFDILTIE